MHFANCFKNIFKKEKEEEKLSFFGVKLTKISSKNWLSGLRGNGP